MENGAVALIRLSLYNGQNLALLNPYTHSMLPFAFPLIDKKKELPLPNMVGDGNSFCAEL